MKVIIVGPGSSGKDHLKRKFESKGFKKSISYTTRPKRLGEVDGVDYFFVNDEEFLAIQEKNEFLECQSYNTKINDKDITVFYGTTILQFNTCNIFIMTPSGIKDLTTEQRNDSMIIYLDIPENIRLERLSKRINGDDVQTRIMNDRRDFDNFKDYDVKIENSDF